MKRPNFLGYKVEAMPLSALRGVLRGMHSLHKEGRVCVVAWLRRHRNVRGFNFSIASSPDLTRGPRLSPDRMIFREALKRESLRSVSY